MPAPLRDQLAHLAARVAAIEAESAAKQALIDKLRAELDELQNHVDGIDYSQGSMCDVMVDGWHRAMARALTKMELETDLRENVQALLRVLAPGDPTKPGRLGGDPN